MQFQLGDLVSNHNNPRIAISSKFLQLPSDVKPT